MYPILIIVLPLIFAFFPHFFFLPIPEHVNLLPIVPVTLYRLPHQIAGKQKFEGNEDFWMQRLFLGATAGLRIAQNNLCVRKKIAYGDE